MERRSSGKWLRGLIAVSAVLFITSCVGGSILAPKTTEQRVEYARATQRGLNEGILQLSRSNLITSDQLKYFYAKSVRAKNTLDAADNYLKLGEEVLAAESWDKANLLLIELNNLLLEQAQKEKMQ